MDSRRFSVGINRLFNKIKDVMKGRDDEVDLCIEPVVEVDTKLDKRTSLHILNLSYNSLLVKEIPSIESVEAQPSLRKKDLSRRLSNISLHLKEKSNSISKFSNSTLNLCLQEANFSDELTNEPRCTLEEGAEVVDEMEDEEEENWLLSKTFLDKQPVSSFNSLNLNQKLQSSVELRSKLRKVSLPQLKHMFVQPNDDIPKEFILHHCFLCEAKLCFKDKDKFRYSSKSINYPKDRILCCKLCRNLTIQLEPIN